MSAKLLFKASEAMTLGVELELQLIDPRTFDLKPAADELMSTLTNRSSVKPEIFQSMLEINSAIHTSAHNIRDELHTIASDLINAGDEMGVLICGGGTHPFADYRERIPHPTPRYKEIINKNQWIARRLQIFGFHIHVGMRSGDHAIQVNNALLHHLPLLLALSANSPFCEGQETNLASARSTFFESTPAGGHPCLVNDWTEFESVYRSLIKSESIGSPNDIWWDIRPSPKFGTLEIRIFDAPSSIEEVESLTAYVHALCVHIDNQLARGKRFPPPPMWMFRENKWRAARFGMDAQLIVSQDGTTAPAPNVLNSTLLEMSDVIHGLSYSSQMRHLVHLSLGDSGYQRQRDVFYRCGNLTAVVQTLVEQFRSGRTIEFKPAVRRAE